MKLKLRAFKCLLFVLALLPSACHYTITGPALWSHNSSAAFDAWLFLWALAIVMPIVVVFLPLDGDGDGVK